MHIVKMLHAILGSIESYWLHDIRTSLVRNRSKCKGVRMVQYIPHRKAGERSKAGIEPKSSYIDYDLRNGKPERVVDWLADLAEHQLYGVLDGNEKLFAIDAIEDRLSIDIHTIPGRFELKSTVWTTLARRYLNMRPDNTSVVLVYDDHDVTTVHGTRYPEFIEHGIDALIRNGATPLFWYVCSYKGNRHLYLYLVDRPELVKLLVDVRARDRELLTK